jgi:hypothetical protein
MKKLNLFALVVVMISTLAITSCKKYEEGGKMSKRATEKNIVQTWSPDVILRDGSNVTDVFTQKNYIFEIQSTNTYSIKERGLPIETGRWNFSEDRSEFIKTLDGTNQVVPCTISKLTKDEFWFKVTEQNHNWEWRMKINK